MKIFRLLLLLVCISSLSPAQSYQPDWSSLDKRPVPAWYKDVKFGIFIHWGVYSVPAFCTKGNYAEWYQHALKSGDTATIHYHQRKFGNRTYYQLADDFKAELFNPDEWADVFEKSGAKYIVLTSKHHDGFANWPSKEASSDWGFPWNAMEAGPHRDLLGDLFKAVRKTTVHAGMYFSLYEWYNPLWLSDRKKYVAEHAWPQMKNLINTYQPDVFWTDGEWEASEEVWKSKEFLAWMYNESPVKDRVVTYDRWGSGVRFHHGGVYTPEYQPDLDFEDHYWEESRGMGFSYGYNREEDVWDYNSSRSLVLQLIDKVSRGGNFLLDIGPDGHGKIPPIMQERLLDIGRWLKVNGEAIYQTRRWRVPAQWSPGRRDYKPANGGGDILLKLTIDPDPGYAVKECFFTYNPTTNNLYALLPAWPASGKFTIHDLPLKNGSSIQLLETGQQLSWQQNGNDVEIRLPVFDPGKIKEQDAYVLKIAGNGAFAARPAIMVSHLAHALKPLVKISTPDSSSIRYTLDGSIPDEKAPLYSGPFSVDTSCMLSARSFKKDLLPGNVSTAALKVYQWKKAVNPGVISPGLKLESYLFESIAYISQLENATPVKTSVVSSISIHDTLHHENAGSRYEGFIKIPSDGIYTFYLSSDDGSGLWLDGENVIDNDGLHGDDEKTGQAYLKKGYHAFRFAYFQAKGEAALHLGYSIENGARTPIPVSWLFHK